MCILLLKHKFLSQLVISCLLLLTSVQSQDEHAKPVSSRAADAKASFYECVCNVCLYVQVICVYVKGSVKRSVSCYRKQHRTVCCWNSSTKLGF